MTAVQAATLPDLLEGKDVVAQAMTGSGKTAAFGLALLNKLDVSAYGIQALVLCPTRELADQVATEIRRLARAIPNVKVITLVGGVPLHKQLTSLEKGVHIVVGTPGRVVDHLSRGLDLSAVKQFVLDEADRMLDMGFERDMDYVTSQMPDDSQTMLFSATYPKKINAMVSRVMDKPTIVKVEGNNDKNIAQHFYQVTDEESRINGIERLLYSQRPESALIFCNTKKDCQIVANALQQSRISVLALHGDLEQKDRDQRLVQFANKSASVLVATDVAARGLDIDDLDMVINYHVASDTEVHVHRVGRTGRAGKQGEAHSFFSSKESHKIKRLSDYLKQDIKTEPLPEMPTGKRSSYQPTMMTLRISGGKKQKLRPGDILGALTGDKGIEGKKSEEKTGIELYFYKYDEILTI